MFSVNKLRLSLSVWETHWKSLDLLQAYCPLRLSWSFLLAWTQPHSTSEGNSPPNHIEKSRHPAMVGGRVSNDLATPALGVPLVSLQRLELKKSSSRAERATEHICPTTEQCLVRGQRTWVPGLRKAPSPIWASAFYLNTEGLGSAIAHKVA